MLQNHEILSERSHNQTVVLMWSSTSFLSQENAFAAALSVEAVIVVLQKGVHCSRTKFYRHSSHLLALVNRFIPGHYVCGGLSGVEVDVSCITYIPLNRPMRKINDYPRCYYVRRRAIPCRMRLNEMVQHRMSSRTLWRLPKNNEFSGSGPQ